MKVLKMIVLSVVISTVALQAQTSGKSARSVPVNKVEAYYFHYSTRCVTCKTVESEAKKDLQTLYPQLAKNGTITFRSINLDEKTSASIADKLKVSGQTLLLVRGSKQVNITNEGFLYARSNPAKFKSVIKKKVDELMK